MDNKSLGFIKLRIFTRFLFYTFRRHEWRRYLSEFQLTLLQECLSWVCSEIFKDFADASKTPNCHLRGQAFPTELHGGVCSDDAQELRQTERGMHLNWVKGNLQLPGSREGARNNTAGSPAGLHVHDLVLAVQSPLIQRDSKSRCLHPAPHSQSQRAPAVEQTFTGSHPYLLNRHHHTHKLK